MKDIKYYDKNIYEKEKIFEAVIVVIIAFLIGFATGYTAVEETEVVQNESSNITN